MDVITNSVKKLSRSGEREFVIEFSSKSELVAGSLYEVSLHGRKHYFQVASVTVQQIPFYQGEGQVKRERVYTAKAKNVKVGDSTLIANMHLNPKALIGQSVSPVFNTIKREKCVCLEA